MENEPSCKCENSKEEIRPEQLYTLVLHDLVDNNIRIKVTESRLTSVIGVLSKGYFIEIE